MRVLPSSLYAALGQSPLSSTSAGFNFKSFQYKAFCDMGIDGSLLTNFMQHGSSTDDSSSSSSASDSDADPGSLLRDLRDMNIDITPQDIQGVNQEGHHDFFMEGVESTGRKERLPNRWGYTFGNWMESPYYRNYLHPDVIQRTYDDIFVFHWF